MAGAAGDVRMEWYVCCRVSCVDTATTDTCVAEMDGSAAAESTTMSSGRRTG